MNILGIGTDIVECLRIAQMIERHGELFIDRVYTATEIEYCRSRKQATQHFAGRWAAKEAILKALGTGWRRGISWRDIEVRNNTFDQADRAIVFDGMPAAGSDGLAFRRNLFVGTGTADAVVAEGYDRGVFAGMLTTQGVAIEQNVTTRGEPSPLDLFSSRGQVGANIAFSGLDPAQTNFLAPPAGSPAKLPSGDGPDGYVGAVPPQ